MTVKEFYKEMYGEDAPQKFDEMESKISFDFAEAYAQQQAGEKSEQLVNFVWESYKIDRIISKKQYLKMVEKARKIN